MIKLYRKKEKILKSRGHIKIKQIEALSQTIKDNYFIFKGGKFEFLLKFIVIKNEDFIIIWNKLNYGNRRRTKFLI